VEHAGPLSVDKNALDQWRVALVGAIMTTRAGPGSGEGWDAMPEADTPWMPHVGEYVVVNATGEAGQVMDIIGSADDRWFVVAVEHQPLRDHPPVPPMPPLRTYSLDDLSPAPRP
jgi:hypothetical protein